MFLSNIKQEKPVRDKIQTMEIEEISRGAQEMTVRGTSYRKEEGKGQGERSVHRWDRVPI